MPRKESQANSDSASSKKPSAREERDRARIAKLKEKNAAAAFTRLQREQTTLAPEELAKSPKSAKAQLADLRDRREKNAWQAMRVKEMQPKVQDADSAKKPRQQAIKPGAGFNPLAGTEPFVDEFGRLVAPVRIRGADCLEEQEDRTAERTSGSIRYMTGWSGDHNKRPRRK